MRLASGTYTLGPDDGSLVVNTRREGAAALVGHDLTLQATTWHATVVVDGRSAARSSLRATVDARSLVVVDASGGAVGLTDSQRDEIARNTRDKVLHSATHRTITFVSSAVTAGTSRVSLSGTLTIRGVARPATLAVRIDHRPAVPRVRATCSIVQTDYGITPYSALLGALRVRDVVDITVDVRLPAPRQAR